MIIPEEVEYKTLGKSRKITRNVVGFVYPTAIYQAFCKIGISRELMPLRFDLGDVPVDWSAATSAGYEEFMK